MNKDSKQTLHADFQSRLDRLVDGELSRDEYQALLSALDEEPGGWKRCALTFLESQALAGELGEVRRSLDLSHDQPARKPAAASLRSEWHSVGPWLAVAASFLCALTLGIMAPKLFSLRQDQPFAGNFNTEPSRHEVFRPVGNLRLVMDSPTGETTQAGQVPVYEVGQDLEGYLSSSQPALGPELIDYLRQHGYDVQHEQQYIPAPLDDGRQIIVPVDGYQITPVARRY